jgi:hypothetical protein
MPQIGIAPYNQIAVVNKSTACNDTDGNNMVVALNTLMPQFCRDWNLPNISIVYIGKNKNTTIPLQCILFDNADVAGALGYHDETLNDLPYAKVFVKTTLQSGGAMLLGANASVPTVASVVAHEVFEMIVDLRANVWWMLANNSTLYAAEVCDPVEGNLVIVQVPNGGPRVGLSDWILPAWSDPFAKSGPYNHLNTLRAPLTVDRNGYAIVLSNGNISYVFGDKRPDAAKDPKALCSRMMTREARGKKQASIPVSQPSSAPAPSLPPQSIDPTLPIPPHIALMNAMDRKMPPKPTAHAVQPANALRPGVSPGFGSRLGRPGFSGPVSAAADPPK